MNDVSAQLHQWSDALAGAVAPTKLEMIMSQVGPVTEPQTNRRWLAIAASVVLVVGGLLAITSLDRGGSEPIVPGTDSVPAVTDGSTSTIAQSTTTTTDLVVVATPQPTTSTSVETSSPKMSGDRLAGWPQPPTEVPPLEGVPLFLPTAPESMVGAPVRAAFDGGSLAPPTFTQVFADAERDIVFTIQTRPAGVDSTPEAMRLPVAIDGWDNANLTNGNLPLVASDQGGFVSLIGARLDVDEAILIVESMTRRGNGSPGWELSDRTPGFAELNGVWQGNSPSRLVTWFDGGRVIAQMPTSPGDPHLIAQALTPSFEAVDVDGVDALLSSGDDRRSIVWSPDGETIVVLAVTVDDIDLLAMARSVVELNADQYEASTTEVYPPWVGDGCDASLFC